jgi:site-specific DNA-methyltransferase (adenine-specific)/adenine-specific DNA-methyltransferase
MPTLNWIGKDAVVKHHLEVPFHLLKDVPELSCGDPGTGNIIAQGDNLIALKALLPHFAGQVKCVCIDPPYNTGNEGWAYNDNVNSPVIREWLGKVVGKEGETLDRHDRWLCMMYPRLALLKKFLRKDGLIFVHIDDVELNNLLTIMDDLFGRDRRIAIFTWVRKRKGSNLSKEMRKVTEYVVAYKHGTEKLELHGTPAYAEKMVPLLNRSNPRSRLVFPAMKMRVGRGFTDEQVTAGVKAAEKGELAVTLENSITIKNELIQEEFTMSGRWRWSQETVNHEIENGSIFVFSKDFRVNISRFDQAEKFKAPQSLLAPDDGVGTNEDATEELRDIFSDHDKLPFDFPKPTSLLSYLISSATGPGDLILDSFAGSGTTAHAILNLNRSYQTSETGPNNATPRRFILVELESEIAREVTAKRVRRVVEGYTNAKGEKVPGLGGGFRFCELGEPLFDESGHIRETVKFGELARHVYFCETREPLPRERVANTPLLGVCRGLAVYLLFNGILGDKSSNGGNVLTRKTLAKLPPFKGPKVIYCAGCLIGSERLAEEGITVRQTPYEIRVS